MVSKITNPFDTDVPPEAVGLEDSISPFVAKNTSQRNTMMASNIYQALAVDGAEQPRIASGNEKQFMEYSFDPTKRKDDVTVFRTISRFQRLSRSSNPNPRHSVIVIDSKGVADVIELSDYTKIHNGFGYMNTKAYGTMMACSEPGTIITKDTRLQLPPTIRDGLYCMGVNANVCYTTTPMATEDAIKISDKFAEKITSTAISTIKIDLPDNCVPVNLYGSVDEPKLFPDIGEYVHDDGILMAIRDKTVTNLPNLLPGMLQKVLYGDDKLVRVRAGARILDVQIHMAHRAFAANSKNPGIMDQIIKYQEMHYAYYKQLIAAYEELKADGYKISQNFADEVYSAMCTRKPQGGKAIQLVDKRRQIKNCTLEITYLTKRKCGVGFKIAGRAGDKGVVPTIVPENEMAIDEQGVIADMELSIETCFNRTNLSQLYEQFINRQATLFTLRLRAGEYGEDLAAYSKIIEFISDVHLKYGKMLDAQNNTNEQKLDMVDDVLEDGVYFIMPPYLSEIVPARIRFLADKWDYVKSPITFTVNISPGVKKTFTTMKPTSIGSKYVYLLGKIPDLQMGVVELAHINQVGMPIKPKREDVKMQYSISGTPIRFGEDEIGVLSISLTEKTLTRFIMSRSGSVQAANKSCETVLTTRRPSAIKRIPMTTKKMVETSDTIRLLYHEFGIVGFDLSTNSKGRK